MKSSILARYLLSTGLLAFLVGTNCIAQSKASEVYRKFAPTTVLIKTDQGGGTGFIVSSTGIIVTALHVVEGASKVAIKTLSGDIYDRVSLLAKDSRKDIAILKIPGFNLPSVELGNSDDPVLGDQLVVLGNPLAADELKASVSDGILSGVRDLGEGFKVLQITAPVSTGNSGGAVFTSEGKVVGVVSFKIVKGDSLNFAIPINYVRGLIEAIDPGKSMSIFDGGDGKADPFSNKDVKGISGRWKAHDGEILQIRDNGTQVEVLNLTYPATLQDALWMGDLIFGTVYRGKSHGGNAYYLMKLNEFGRLLYWWFDDKSKERPEQRSKRINDTLKKKPDAIFFKID